MANNNEGGNSPLNFIKFLKDRVSEELDGSLQYLKKALDIMPTNTERAELLKNIAIDKQKHATELYRMFMQYFSEECFEDPYSISIRDSLMDIFSDKMRKVEDIKVTYSLMYSGDEQDV